MKNQIFMTLNKAELWLGKTGNNVAEKCNRRVEQRMEKLKYKYGVVKIIQ